MTVTIKLDTGAKKQPNESNYASLKNCKFAPNITINNATMGGMAVQMTTDGSGGAVDELTVDVKNNKISCHNGRQELSYIFNTGEVVVITIGDDNSTFDVELPA